MDRYGNSSVTKKVKYPSILYQNLNNSNNHLPSILDMESSTPQDTSPYLPLQINPIYEKVFEFPANLAYLKYFGTNPHPENFPAESQFFAKSFFKKDLNTPLLQKQIQFQLTKDKLWPALSEKEKRMFLLPEKFNKLIPLIKDEGAKIALAHLRDVFLTYLSSPIDANVKPDIQWIDFNYATNYSYAKEVLDDLENNLLNPKAKLKLEEKLRESGAFKKENVNFYFWNTSPHNWSDISYQSRPVIHFLQKKPPYFKNWPPLGKGVFGVIPQYAALGDFTINAIPEGSVRSLGSGKYEVCVTKVYLFVNDTFNFEEKEYLGAWDLNDDKDCQTWGYTPITHLTNGDFRNYKRHGYGPDFPVLSRLHQSKNFKPECWTVQNDK